MYLMQRQRRGDGDVLILYPDCWSTNCCCTARCTYTSSPPQKITHYSYESTRDLLAAAVLQNVGLYAIGRKASRYWYCRALILVILWYLVPGHDTSYAGCVLSTRRHPAQHPVSVLILHPRDTSAVVSKLRHRDTTITAAAVYRNAAKRDNSLPPYAIVLDSTGTTSYI